MRVCALLLGFMLGACESEINDAWCRSIFGYHSNGFPAEGTVAIDFDSQRNGGPQHIIARRLEVSASSTGIAVSGCLIEAAGPKPVIWAFALSWVVQGLPPPIDTPILCPFTRSCFSETRPYFGGWFYRCEAPHDDGTRDCEKLYNMTMTSSVEYSVYGTARVEEFDLRSGRFRGWAEFEDREVPWDTPRIRIEADVAWVPPDAGPLSISDGGVVFDGAGADGP